MPALDVSPEKKISQARLTRVGDLLLRADVERRRIALRERLGEVLRELGDMARGKKRKETHAKLSLYAPRWRTASIRIATAVRPFATAMRALSSPAPAPCSALAS